MKQDNDLIFLSSCNNEDLRALCDILTHDKKGELRISEELTNTDAYLHYYPEHMNLMAKELCEELRKYGTNTVKTLCRNGEADSYSKIVHRVCRRLKVSISDNDSTIEMERKLMQTAFEKCTSQLTDEELRSLADKAGIPHKSLNRQMLVYAIMVAVRRNVVLLSEIIYYITMRIAYALVGRGVMIVGMNTIGRYISMAAGPVGWALLAGWTISDIASPAYRVIIPAVLMIASMRFRQTALLTQKC